MDLYACLFWGFAASLTIILYPATTSVW